MTPDVDFNEIVYDLVPNNKRKPKWIAFIRGILSQTIKLGEKFKIYRSGEDSIDNYDDSYVYTAGDLVLYKGRIYSSTILFPTSGNLPDVSPSAWELVSSNWIGIERVSRIRYNRIVLEWALNKYFQYELNVSGFPIGFRQPDTDTTSYTRSDIYITNFSLLYSSFISYGSNLDGSLVFSDQSSDFVFQDEKFNGQTNYKFIINFPQDAFDEVDLDSTIAYKVIYNFLKPFIPEGIDFTIETY